LLGYGSVSKMLSELTSYEISEWIAYFNVKQEKLDQAEDEREKADAAKRRAKENNQ